MASRRPSEPPRTTDAPKEIPKAIKADEKAAVSAPKRKPAAPRAKRPSTTAPARVAVSEDVRRGMIAEGAYLRAERRGFAPGHEEEDWVAAEAEVDALLKARDSATSQ
jgi:hypothetical protein